MTASIIPYGLVPKISNQLVGKSNYNNAPTQARTQKFWIEDKKPHSSKTPT